MIILNEIWQTDECKKKKEKTYQTKKLHLHFCQYTLMSCRFPLPSHTAILIIIIHLADALIQSNLERPFKEYIYQFVLGIEPMTLA